MAASVPTEVPSELTAGDTWEWSRSFADYTPADGWALAYEFGGPEKFTVDGSSVVASGSGWRITFKSNSARLPGTYQCTAQVKKSDGTTKTLERGTVTIRSIVADQFFAEKQLAAVEAVIAGRIPADVEQYAIGDRSLTKMSMKDLLYLRGYFAAEVARARRGNAFRSVTVAFCE